MKPSAPTAEIVVVGGGIAALEAVLALRELAGNRVHMTLVADQPDFVLRPTLAAEALGRRGAQRHPLGVIAADLGIDLVPAAVASVDAEGHRVILRRGEPLPYDSLILAHGARTVAAFDDPVVALGGTVEAQELRTLRDAIANGEVRSVAFVAPMRTGWLLPLYEAALLAAHSSHGLQVALVTRETRPLEAFGPEASATVAKALETAGVEFIAGQTAAVSEGTVLIPRHPLGSLSVDRIVALGLVRGLRIAGIPTSGLFGLVAVDPYGRVKGLKDVYAAGDATDYPVKHGSIAGQQADVVAAVVAARAGAAVTPEPFEPILRATLRTGAGEPIPLGEGAGVDELAKVPGRYLAPYLRKAAELLAA
jgi:sulfide:quinone oxidoreductase